MNYNCGLHVCFTSCVKDKARAPCLETKREVLGKCWEGYDFAQKQFNFGSICSTVGRCQRLGQGALNDSTPKF